LIQTVKKKELIQTARETDEIDNERERERERFDTDSEGDR